jgi:hypothetical protein
MLEARGLSRLVAAPGKIAPEPQKGEEPAEAVAAGDAAEAGK